MRWPRIFARLRVGRADVSPAAPSHVPGVRGGNERAAVDQPGFHSTGQSGRRGVSDVRGSAARSTGINPRARDPIDPGSPNLSPP